MTKFEILVSRGYQKVFNGTVHIEAATQEEAEAKALEYAKNNSSDIVEEGIFEGIEWDECGYNDEDLFYQVEDVDEVPEVYPYYCDCHKEGFESMEEMAAHEKEIGAIGDDL